MLPLRDLAGQTLVDLAVALALLALTLSSAGILATAAARTGSEGGRRTQATTLATREMEALRNYRDSLARTNQSWAGVPSGVCNPGNGATFVLQRAAAGLDKGLYGTSWNIVNTATPAAYGESDNPGYGTDYDGFSRLISVCDFPGNSNEKAVQIKVSWQEGSRMSQVSFSTVLTNWK